MRHVIIEGPDGAGKTHLADLICSQRPGYAYHHEGPPPAGLNVLEHYARLMLDAKCPTVFDRLHLGEVVYGSLLRGGSALSPRDILFLNRLIVGQGTSVVLCLPPKATCLHNNRLKEELIKEESLRSVAYDAWVLVSKRFELLTNLQRYDYTEQGQSFSLKWYPSLPPGVIGSPRARVLFIGEQPNGSLDLPFFGAKGSSQYLQDCIDQAHLTEAMMAFTNARTATGEDRDLEFIIQQIPNLDVVVPLGKVAERLLEKQDAAKLVHVESMPHPAYWKRFHSKAQSTYVSLLQGVLDHVA